MPAGAPPTGDLADKLRAEAEFWGIDWDGLAKGEQATFAAQERALKAYEQTRRIDASADAAGIHARTIYRWRDDPPQTMSFPDRLARADSRYVSRLEKVALDRIENPQGNKGSDLLLIAALNAHAPGRWKRRDERTVTVNATVSQRSEVVHSLSDDHLARLIEATEPDTDRGTPQIVAAEARELPTDEKRL